MREIVGARFRNPFLIPDFIFNLTSMGRTQRETLFFAQSVIDKVYIFINILCYFLHYTISIIM
jgi:hypothetical protein